MRAELKKNSVNQIIKGLEVFVAGDEVTEIGLVIKGRVRVTAPGVNLVIGSGNFLGLCDLDRNCHSVTYVAETNLAVYSFATTGLLSSIRALMKVNKDYAPLMVSTLSKYIRELSKIYDQTEIFSGELWQFATESYQNYLSYGKAAGTQTMSIPRLEKLEMKEDDEIVNLDKTEYYRALADFPSEIQKAYFGCNAVVTTQHIAEQVRLVQDLLQQCRMNAEYLESAAGPLIKDNKSLYQAVLQQINAMQRAGQDAGKSSSLFDDIIDHINSLENLLIEQGSIDLAIDHDAMEREYFEVISGANSMSSSSHATSMDGDLALVEQEYIDIDELSGALDQILDYAGLDEEAADGIREAMQTFEGLTDKFATDDEVRTLRRTLLKAYYDLYQRVFLKDYHSIEDTPIIIDLFLRYGFMSENVVSNEIMEELLALDTRDSGTGACAVYDMKEWLTLILEGKKEPSKSEFDLDYDQNLREMRKSGQITAEQQQTMSRDTKAKFEYEIQNMFRTNHRLMFSQVTAFVPFLFTEGCTSSIDRSYLAKDKVNAAIQRVKQIDYSVFYRESLYAKEKSAFAKEYIQEEVYPDIILFPGYGNKGVMWQEISGRRRNSKGRFLLPSFMEGSLEDVIIKLFGRFRWELCRTIQGSSWNNIQIKSLTSEYSDFIQFYKKNRELSEDKKEKLKMQIQKSRNNTREVFVIDYENWIKHEAQGGLTLSKPVREIMATYCPFPAELREKVSEQPMFRDAMARFNRERGKRTKEYELRFRVWERDGIDVPVEVLETKRFYTEF